MALHQTIQRLLIIGVRPHVRPQSAPPPPPPPRLLPLIAALAPAHRSFDERAVFYGHRYRSGFWAIYLLSAVAVLCAILPLALGWDRENVFHPFSGFWAVAEVGVIATVCAIYWLGHRRDWQGQWLRTRTTAELTWYLPLVAPLVDFTPQAANANWYLREFDPDRHLPGADAVTALCASNEALARQLLEGAWLDNDFVTGYAQWTIGILDAQQHYHLRVAGTQHALLHRVHGINSWLFGLTACGATLHLLLHALWLTLVTTFFPALGASLHGALAQSEAYRLGSTSERLAAALQRAIDDLQAAIRDGGPVPAADAIKASIEGAIALILEEHQDWQMLVRPHQLPLA